MTCGGGSCAHLGWRRCSPCAGGALVSRVTRHGGGPRLPLTSLRGTRRRPAPGMRPALLPVVLLALQVWPAPARDPAVFCGGEWVRGQRGTAAGQAPFVPPRPPPLHPRAPEGAALWGQTQPPRPRPRVQRLQPPLGGSRMSPWPPCLWVLGLTSPLRAWLSWLSCGGQAGISALGHFGDICHGATGYWVSATIDLNKRTARSSG